MLSDFIAQNRDEILTRAQLRASARNEAAERACESPDGLPLFLDQLGEALRHASSGHSNEHVAIKESAGDLGDTLFHEGLTVSQVVNGYGDLCQVITGLASEHSAPIAAEEFRTLNLCLDEATARAVTSYSRQRERAITEEGTERLGGLAHEMRNVLNAVIMSVRMIKSGIVPAQGSTGAILDRNLSRMQTLIDRSLADVRLDAGMQNVERMAVRHLIEEVEIGAAMVAHTRGLNFVVTSVDKTVFVDADRQILAAAVANLLQNAFMFTHKGTTVRLRASATPTRVLIEIEDECGGLPVKHAETLLRPFVQKGRNRSGLGLGLSICVKAVKAMSGELRITDHPGEGCVFTIDLPRQAPRATSIRPAKPKGRSVPLKRRDSAPPSGKRKADAAAR
jgi:signal transduction histidine kinase